MESLLETTRPNVLSRTADAIVNNGIGRNRHVFLSRTSSCSNIPYSASAKQSAPANLPMDNQEK